MKIPTTSAPEETATARAWPETGEIVATVVLRASPQRVFEALTTNEICDWWVRPGVFDTHEWSSELREGGRWTASGMGGGRPYELEGEFLEIDEPRSLVQTWHPVGATGEPARLDYRLVPHATDVLLTLRHTGIMNSDVLEKTRAGWVTSFERLAQILAAEQGLSA